MHTDNRVCGELAFASLLEWIMSWNRTVVFARFLGQVACSRFVLVSVFSLLDWKEDEFSISTLVQCVAKVVASYWELHSHCNRLPHLKYYQSQEWGSRNGLWKKGFRFFFFFGSSILWCSHICNCPKKELAKFGYRSGRKVEIFKNRDILACWKPIV
jgi:hypothetical protein